MAQATLNGQLIDDGGLTCEVKFEWGATTSYGAETAWQGGFTSGMTFSATITGLAEGALFHFRSVARNRDGIGKGQDMIFVTLAEEGPMSLIDDELLHLLEARG